MLDHYLQMCVIHPVYMFDGRRILRENFLPYNQGDHYTVGGKHIAFKNLISLIRKAGGVYMYIPNPRKNGKLKINYHTDIP